MIKGDKTIVRITVNLPEELVNHIDTYASSLNINRTSSVAILLSTALNGLDAMESLKIMTKEVSQQTENPIDN